MISKTKLYKLIGDVSNALVDTYGKEEGLKKLLELMKIIKIAYKKNEKTQSKVDKNR